MENNGKMRGVWAGSSSTPNRTERVKSHKEFEASDFKRMLDDGWQVKAVKPKRPRIKKDRQPRQVVVSLGDVMAATVTISWENYQKFGKGMKIVMKIY